MDSGKMATTKAPQQDDKTTSTKASVQDWSDYDLDTDYDYGDW